MSLINNSYFESKNVKVYPAAFRGNYEVTNGQYQFDPEARVPSEYNLLRSGGALNNKASFIVSYDEGANNTLKCVIGGYYFELYNVDLADFNNNGSIKTLGIALYEFELNNTDVDIKRMSKRLASRHGEQTGSLDALDTASNKYFFTGILVSDSDDHADATLQPIVLDENNNIKLNYGAFLPQIKAGLGIHTTDTETSVTSIELGVATKALGNSAIAGGNTTVAASKNSLAIGENTVAFGDNSIASGKGSTKNYTVTAIDTNANKLSINDTTGLRAGDIINYSIYYFKVVSVESNYITIEQNDNISKIIANTDIYKITGIAAENAIAENYRTVASGNNSHAEGELTIAAGQDSHAEGNETKAYGANSHAEGKETESYGDNSHAEGNGVTAHGANSHAEGHKTVTGNSSDNIKGMYAHAEGEFTEAIGAASHAEGYRTKVTGSYAHAEGENYGNYINASGKASHTEGYYTKASGSYSHAEGYTTKATGDYSHSEGNNTTAADFEAHAEGNTTEANGPTSHAEGTQTKANGSSSHAEGFMTTADGNYAHAEGGSTNAEGDYAHAEGYKTIAKGSYSHAEGESDNTNYINAEGQGSHSEGYKTKAKGDYSHSEGYKTVASGLQAHSSGDQTQATGNNATAMGSSSIAKGNCSLAAGTGTIAENANEVVFGKYNANSHTNKLFVIGDGEDNGSRKDALSFVSNSSKTIKVGTDRTEKTLGYDLNINGIELLDIIKSQLLDTLYPVGSVYTCTTDASLDSNKTCPVQKTLGGKWVRIEDTFLYASKDNLTNYRPGDKGGSKNAIVVSHKHGLETNVGVSITNKNLTGTVYTGRGEFERNLHTVMTKKDDATANGTNGIIRIDSGYGSYTPSGWSDYHMQEVQLRPNQWHKPDRIKLDASHSHTCTITQPTIASNGNSGVNANMPPYTCVYMWKRVADNATISSSSSTTISGGAGSSTRPGSNIIITPIGGGTSSGTL